jgi:hypothetical protein
VPFHVIQRHSRTHAPARRAVDRVNEPDYQTPASHPSLSTSVALVFHRAVRCRHLLQCLLQHYEQRPVQPACRAARPPRVQCRLIAAQHRRTERAETRSLAATWSVAISTASMSAASKRSASRLARARTVRPPPCAYLMPRTCIPQPTLSPWRTLAGVSLSDSAA